MTEPIVPPGDPEVALVAVVGVVCPACDLLFFVFQENTWAVERCPFCGEAMIARDRKPV